MPEQLGLLRAPPRLSKARMMVLIRERMYGFEFRQAARDGRRLRRRTRIRRGPRARQESLFGGLNA